MQSHLFLQLQLRKEFRQIDLRLRQQLALFDRLFFVGLSQQIVSRNDRFALLFNLDNQRCDLDQGLLGRNDFALERGIVEGRSLCSNLRGDVAELRLVDYFDDRRFGLLSRFGRFLLLGQQLPVLCYLSFKLIQRCSDSRDSVQSRRVVFTLWLDRCFGCLVRVVLGQGVGFADAVFRAPLSNALRRECFGC